MKTPCYIFSKKMIKDNYEQMCHYLNQCKVHYSTKANGHAKVLATLSQLSANFEICSLMEWDELIQMEVKPENIIFGLPVKPEELICKLYDKGCRYFIFDTITELEKLNRLAPQALKVLRIMVSDIVDDCIPYGMNPSQITQSIVEQCDGLHFHITRNNNIDRQMLALNRIEEILEQFSLHDIILNIGGSYCLSPQDDYYDTLNRRLAVLKRKYRLKLYAEPGEAIIHTAGSVYTTVLAMKEQKTNKDVYIDFGEPGGLSLRPKQLSVINRDASAKRCFYRFYDNTCRHTVRFSKILPLDITVNDCLKLSPYGAYTLCLCNDFHNFPRPEVYIEK